MGANPTPEGSQRQLPCVLVVEDEVLTRMTLADHLRSCDYLVIEAVDGEEGMLVLQSGQAVDVLFTDVNLPGLLNGFDLARWACQNRPQTRIIITSGLDRATHEASDLCDDVPYLMKPYDPSGLVGEIERLLGSV